MTARPCPVCTKPATAAYSPFCSCRCADVDLQRWFSGAYVAPGRPVGGPTHGPADDDDDA